MTTQRIHPIVTAALAAGILAGCQTAPPHGQTAAPSPAPVTTPQPVGPQVVDVMALDYAIRAPEVISSGWTTVRFRNEGQEHHLVIMSRLPEGKTIEDYQQDLSAPFARGWEALKEERVDQEQALAMIFEALPAWFPALQFVGGPGLAAPGVTSAVTMNLEPGNYVLECYLKAADGKLHFMEGMIRPLTVSASRSGARTPTADIRVTLSNFDMDVQGDLAPGRRTIAVHVSENPEQGFGHSVHVARLDHGASADDVVRWMNWLDLNGLRAPAPARFAGGVNMMPTGSTAYVTVDLEPGRYLFVSEATGAQGVRKEVTVR